MPEDPNTAPTTGRAPATALAPGTPLPDRPVRLLRDGRWQDATLGELARGRRVVLFGLPGAFTPTCSTQQVPRYEEVAPVLRAHGIEDILCITVNDEHVVAAWAREHGARQVAFIADGNGELTAALGMLVDKRGQAMGFRSRRYSLLAQDARVEALFAEPDVEGDPYTVSDADTMLHAVAPQAAPPDQVVIFTRAGCPHCAHARELLEQAGFDYVDIPLGADIRHRVTAALANRETVPLVYLNGTLIGGADDLAVHLQGPTGPAESRPT
jgi:peroxiredoxin